MTSISILGLQWTPCNFKDCPRTGQPCVDCGESACVLHSETCVECRKRVCENCEEVHSVFCLGAKGDYAGGPGTPELERKL